MLQSDCSDLMSKWRGHTTILVNKDVYILSRQLSCSEATARHAQVVRRRIFMFLQDGAKLHQHATLSLSWSEREMWETCRRLCAFVRVRGTFQARILTILSRSVITTKVITLLNKPHSNEKPRTIRPRKDLFDHFDDEEFKKRFRLTKSTVTKLLEQLGIPADCAAAAPQSFLFLSIFVGLYFTLLLQHKRAGVWSFTTTDIINHVGATGP